MNRTLGDRVIFQRLRCIPFGIDRDEDGSHTKPTAYTAPATPSAGSGELFRASHKLEQAFIRLVELILHAVPLIWNIRGYLLDSMPGLGCLEK